METLVKCKTCGKELPQTEVLKHYKLEHPRGKEALAQALIKKEPETPPPAPTRPPEPQTPASPPAPEIKPVPSLSEEPQKAEPPSNVPETEEGGKVEITTVKSAGVFTYEITLPADAFTLFNLAKACGLEPNDGKLFDEWVWDCVRARFSKDYKKQLVLAPLEE